MEIITKATNVTLFLQSLPSLCFGLVLLDSIMCNFIKIGLDFIRFHVILGDFKFNQRKSGCRRGCSTTFKQREIYKIWQCKLYSLHSNAVFLRPQSFIFN